MPTTANLVYVPVARLSARHKPIMTRRAIAPAIMASSATPVFRAVFAAIAVRLTRRPNVPNTALVVLTPTKITLALAARIIRPKRGLIIALITTAPAVNAIHANSNSALTTTRWLAKKIARPRPRPVTKIHWAACVIRTTAAVRRARFAIRPAVLAIAIIYWPACRV